MELALPEKAPGKDDEMIKNIAALIPALNAEATVREVVSGTKRHISDVLVIDDGSDDDTGPRAREGGARVIRHEARRGKGAALVAGFSSLLKSGYDAILTLDADGQHDPNDIPGLVRAYDARRPGIIVGSRMSSREDIPRYRLIPNLVGNMFISLATGKRIEDSQSGMRVYSRELLSSITLTSTGYDTETEALIKAGRAGFDIVFVPIRTIYKTGQESHFRPVRDTYRISITYLRCLFID